MASQLAVDGSRGLVELIRLERRTFAAKIRVARAVLGWSQSELGFRVGLTQRAIHKLEQGDTEPRRATVRALEEIFREELLSFEDAGDGGFRMHVHASVLDHPVAGRSRRGRNARLQLGVTSTRRPPTYRA
jgi:transcriptional regulator with XRE-family HTH domain